MTWRPPSVDFVDTSPASRGGLTGAREGSSPACGGSGPKGRRGDRSLGAITLLSVLFALIAALFAAPASAALDLNRAAVTRLDNGLTLIVLEEHSRPIVSVQMLYKVGGRDDPAGRMGLAHFFEHMAFRASANFLGTGLVDEIYAVGGEWHGYTWIDQTTYFATAPASELDLLLRIEADRMGRLAINADDVKAEFGAVLAEMNLYENDLSSVLFDALLAAHFPVHPYGANTIGYEGDIAAITKADLDDVYRRHIRPATGVLAVVGDVSGEDVLRRVEILFGKFKGGDEARLPPSAEPKSAALRRVSIRS
ncbi:MAG: pitrilysin family protein, partial [Parvularculaceae bacterium]